MDIICADVVLHEVIGEFLRHSFGQRGDQDSLVFLDALLYFFHQIVHLVQAWAHFDDGVEQAGRADNLFHHDAFALLQFIVGGSGGYINDLLGQLLELLEFQRAVIHGGRKPETVFHQVLFAGAVAAVHGIDLRYGHVALVDNDQEILGEEVQQAIGACTGFAPVEITRIVLDTAAMPQFAYHFHIIRDSFI